MREKIHRKSIFVQCTRHPRVVNPVIPFNVCGLEIMVTNAEPEWIQIRSLGLDPYLDLFLLYTAGV